MTAWTIDKLRLKKYPHFDAPITNANIIELVSDPKKVASHRFYPFLHFEETYKPFRDDLRIAKKKKKRPIRYAARGDSYIYSKYRHDLSVLYERFLSKEGLEECVIAYRRISKGPNGTGNKSNIEFAKDAIDLIIEMEDCLAITADISSYFENIDHNKLKEKLCGLLNVELLPDDYYAIFKNLTQYHYMDYKEVCRKLGFYGPKDKQGYNTAKKEMPTKLCSNDQFRELCKERDIDGEKILQPNDKPRGIPQGAPLSDLFANLYLVEFDKRMLAYAARLGGSYFRYSDDILLLIPGKNRKFAHECTEFMMNEIEKEGQHIKIQLPKCASLQYFKDGDAQNFEPLSEYSRKERRHKDDEYKDVQRFRMNNGLEYLGFRFDGKKVYLKDKTISNYKRKLRRSAWTAAYKHHHDYKHLKLADAIKEIDFESFFQKFSKVKNFSDASAFADNEKFNNWTFYTYAKRASEAFGDLGTPILKQIRKARSQAKKDLTSKVVKVFTASQPKSG